MENPQDTEVDIGRSAYNIKKVQRAFQHAYDTLIFNNSSSTSLLKLIITCDPKDLRPIMAEEKRSQQRIVIREDVRNEI